MWFSFSLANAFLQQWLCLVGCFSRLFILLMCKFSWLLFPFSVNWFVCFMFNNRLLLNGATNDEKCFIVKKILLIKGAVNVFNRVLAATKIAASSLMRVS